ncbi:MAG TPA: SRPBCC domain-containing protein [Mycobacteriales bacterium]|nr:SRPBCC domain-containing protein [Mycobacteriales bacterium]
MTDITVDHFFAHSPAKVWAALTDPDLLADWLMPNDFKPVVGHRFTFRTRPQPAHGFDGVVHCQVLDLEPPRRLRISWRGGTLDTTVTWTLAAEGRGTRLLIEHAGFDPDDPTQQHTASILGQGWRSHVLRSLHAVLDRTVRHPEG